MMMQTEEQLTEISVAVEVIFTAVGWLIDLYARGRTHYTCVYLYVIQVRRVRQPVIPLPSE
jgi:hypothetical protein